MPLYQEHSRIPGICTLKLLVLDLSDTIFHVLIIQDKMNDSITDTWIWVLLSLLM